MTATLTKMITALTLGAAALTFAGPALAGHNDDRGYGQGKGYSWGQGRNGRGLDVYIDAGRDRELERMIAYQIERQGRYVNVVYSPRYADVTITVNGRTSDLHRHDGYRRYNDGYLSLDYNYKIKVKAGRRTVFNDRVQGQVTEPVRQGWYPGAYEKGELAKDLFGIFVDIVTKNDGGYDYAHNGRYPRDGGRRDEWRLEDRMRLEAYQRIADYVVRVALPDYGGYRTPQRGPGNHRDRW